MSSIDQSNVDRVRGLIRSHFLKSAENGTLVAGHGLPSALLGSKYIPVECSKEEVEQALTELSDAGYLEIGNRLPGAIYPESRITSEGVSWIEQSR